MDNEPAERTIDEPTPRSGGASYTAVGHVCVDELAGDGERLGGTVYFSACQAAAMGCVTEIVTAATESTATALRARVPATVTVSTEPADTDTRFGFGVDADEGPERLVSAAPVLDRIPGSGTVDIVHLGPVFNELSVPLLEDARGRARFLGVTPQGFLRGTGPGGALTFVDANWPEVVAEADAVVVSESEFAHLRASGRLAACRGLVFRTLGPGGAGVFRGEVELHRRRPTNAADVPPQRTIGAGDVFAAAAFVALARGDSADRALEVAVASASTYVQRNGAEPVFVDGGTFSGATVAL